MKPRYPRSLLVSSVFIAIASCASQALATDIVWGTNLGAGPWVWNDGANWTGGTAPVIATDRGDLRKDWSAAATINLNAATIVNGILSDDTGSASDVGVTIGNGGTAGNTLTLAGTTPEINVAGSTLTISAAMAGSTLWTKSGTGTLTLSPTANSAQSGGITVSEGTLSSGTNVQTTGTGPLSVGAATLRSYGPDNATFTANNGNSSISLSGSTWNFPGASNSTYTHTYAFTGTIAANTAGSDPATAIQVANSTLSFAGTNATTTTFNGRLNFSGNNTINRASTNWSHAHNFNRTITGTGTLTFNWNGNATGKNVNIASLATTGTAHNFTGSVVLNTGTGTANFNLAQSLGATSYGIRNGWTLNNNAAGALNSAASVTLVNTGSVLNVSSNSWVNAGASLTITAGTVTLGNGANPGNASIGSLSGAAGSIVTAGTAAATSSLVLNQTADGTFAGMIAPITGTSLTLTKNGAAKLTLSNATPFAGAGTVPLLVNNGSLALGNGTTTFATANVASLAQAGGSLLLDLGGASNDLLNITGDYTHSGGDITVVVAGAPTIGTPYTLVDYGGNLSGTPSVTFQGLANTRVTGSVAYGDGSDDVISVTFSGASANLVWTGATDNIWEVGGTANNWLNGAVPDNYLEFDHVTFNDSATSGNLAPVLDTVITPSSVTFDNDVITYLLTGTGSIGGSGKLTKSNLGTATVATNNTYSGGTDVLGGTLVVGNAGTTGTIGSGQAFVDAGAILAFNRTDTVIPAANFFSGTGTVAQAGAGILQLSAAQGFTGAYIGNAGVIQVGDGSSNTPGSSVSSATGITLNSGATLDLPRLHATTGETPVWSLPAIALQDGARLRFRASTGTTTHNLAATITTSGTTIIDSNGGAYVHNINLSGKLSGSGTINHLATSGSGSATTTRTLTLSNSTTDFSGDWFVDYTGSTTDDFVALRSTAAGALGTGTVTLDDRAQLISTTTGGLDSLAGVTVLKPTATANFGAGWTSPSGVLTVTDGSVVIGSATAFPTVSIASLSQTGGAITLDLGATAGQNDTLMVSGNADFAGGQLVVSPLVNPDDLTFDIVFYGGSLVTPPTVTADAGRLVATVANGTGTNDKITVGFTGDVADLVWKGNDVTSPNNWDRDTTSNWDNAGSPDKFLTFDNVTFDDTAASFTPSIIGSLKTGTVTFNNSTNAYALSGTGAIDGTAALVKSGTNTTTISTANTFTGNVTVNGGKIVLGNAAALGASTAGAKIVTINSTGQLDLNNFNNTTPTRTYTLAIGGAGDGTGAVVNNSGAGIASNAGILNLVLNSDATIGGSQRFDLGFAGGSGTITGNGKTLTKTGANQINLRGDASATPITIIVSQGTLGLENSDNAFGGATGSVTVESAAVVGSFGARTIATPITLQGGATLSNLGGGAGTWTGTITLEGNVTVNPAGQTINLDGIISGIGFGLTVPPNGGTVNLNAANTFSGGLSVGAAATTATTVNIGPASTLGVSAGKEIRIGNTSASGTAVQTLNVNGAVANSGTLYIGRPGVLNVNNGASWTQSGGMSVNGHGGYTATMNVPTGATFTSTGSAAIALNGAAGNSGQALLNISGTMTTSSGFTQTTVPTTGYARINLTGGTIKLGAAVPALTTDVQMALGAGGGIIDTNGFNATLSGVATVGAAATGITGTGTLTKQGAGMLTLTGTNSYSGATTVAAGTLAGKGAAASVLTVASGAAVAPGAGIGTFSCAGATFAAGATLAIEIDSTTDTADQLTASGAVDITGAAISLTEIGSGIIPAGTKLTILNYTGTTLTGAPFSGYNEGSTVTVGSNTFTISYVDSSKVTLTSTTVATPFESWIGTYYPGVTDVAIVGPKADPDGDGVPNSIEFLTNGLPNNNADKGLLWVGTSGNQLVMSLAIRGAGTTFTGTPSPAATVDGFTATVQGDTDLSGFDSPVSGITFVKPDGWSASPPAGFSYHSFKLNSSTGLTGKGFLRLKAE